MAIFPPSSKGYIWIDCVFNTDFRKQNQNFMIDNLGVVLSGGGVKGVAHIGFLQALKEHGIHPQYLSGSSAGALVGALYAAGYEAREMLSFFKNTPLINWQYYSLTKPGLLDSEKYQIFFEKYFPEDSFEALERQLFVFTTELETGQSFAHTKGPLIKPLMASCSIPLIFSPIRINGALHADGGVMNNFPVEPLTDMNLRHILGSYVTAPMPTRKKNLNLSIKVMLRAMELSQEALSNNKFNHCDYVLAPRELATVSFLDTKDIDRAYKIGYEYTLNHMDKILEALTLQLPHRPQESLTTFKVADPDRPQAELSHEEASSNSFFDIWPFNLAFGKSKEEVTSE